MADAFKTVSISPLTGIFDARSSVDQQAVGAFTYKANLEITPDGKLRQTNGFGKPFGVTKTHTVDNTEVLCPYGNGDWHNQGVDVAHREPVTLLFSSTSNERVRKLFAATKTRVIRLNEGAGAWDQIGSGFGNDGTVKNTAIRFRAAELQDEIFFTNAFDQVQYHDLSTDTMQPVPDLTTAGEGGAAISKVSVIIQFQGVIMLMNMFEGANQMASRIRWSNLNDGKDFDISDPSNISDFQDLDYGEAILNAVICASSLYVFTDRAIWKCNFTVDSTLNQATLQCNRVYSEPKNKSKCLAYPNTLVSTGLDMYYAGDDAIYHFNPYLAEPENLEWIYRSTDMIFSGLIQIDRSSCLAPVAEHWPDRNEIHFSWPVVDVFPTNVHVDSCDEPPPQAITSGLNRHTLVINTKFSTCDYRDYGSTALVNFTSDLLATGGCNQNVLFLGANSLDYCIKQFGVGYVREMYDAVSDSFSNVGYMPRFNGVLPLGEYQYYKKLRNFKIDGLADGDNSTSLKLRIGTSFTIQNPNLNIGGCSIIWRTLLNKPIKCLMKKSAADYLATKTRPALEWKWKFLYEGRFFYFEISIVNNDGSPATGGGVYFSRIEFDAIRE